MTRTARKTGRRRAIRAGLVAAATIVFGGAAATSAQAELLSTFEATASTTQAGAYGDVRTNFVLTDLINDPVRTLRFHLPVGLLGSIANFDECSLPDFYSTVGCPQNTQVGDALALLNVGSQEFPFLFPLPSTVHVLTPGRGDTALLGIITPLRPRELIRINVRPDDYGLDATVDALPNNIGGTDLTLWGVPWDHWTPETQAANKRLPFMANPATCGKEAVTSVEVQSYQNQGTWESYSATTPAQTGCELLEFEPTIRTGADAPFTSRPSSFEFGIDLFQNTDPDELATPPIKNVTAVLPEGVSLNPAVAHGLEACTDDAFGQGSSERSSCPAASRVGTAEFEVPVLKDSHVAGTVYIGQPLPGNTYRLFVEAYGSSMRVKLKGTVRPDPKTGQLTAIFENNPEAPVSSVKLAFKGGPRAALAMPDSCGSKPVAATLDSWTGHSVNALTAFDVAFDAKGTPCPPQGFAPSFSAGVSNPVAGASSTFTLQAQKADGQADLTGVALTLPKGLLANLKGNLGTRVGTARVAAGVGPDPFWLSGPVVLEGAYGDAPFSLRVTVPVIAGPFNLGEVVVRQKLYVDPNDAHVTVVSDPLPTIWEGIPVRLQKLTVDIDKPGFMQNPTSCDVQAIGGTLSAVTGQTSPVSSRFQVGDCAGLRYAPKLALALGSDAKQLKNGGHPELTANLKPGKGEANQKKAQVTLPLNLALDPQNAKALCEPAAAARSACPADSIVGSAKAISILDVPLTGPVYFVRGERKTATGRTVATLPKLFIPLSGQGVTINLNASSNVVDRKLQTTFENLPDAPIEDFDLKINGGANGILKVTNGDVCKSTSTPKVGSLLIGQSNQQYRQTSTLAVGCRFGVVKTARKGNRLSVTVGGLTGGKLTVSGSGVSRSSRTVGKASTVASVGVSLNAASRRALQQGRTVRLRVKASFKPSGKKTVSQTRNVVVKPTKK
ncbi:MAG: hypothetical protein WC558_05425 [Patulibacter sp.]